MLFRSALSHYLDNSFISKQGFYNSRLKKLEFLNEVILKNVDYTIRTDTLHYYLKSETAYFLSPSILEQKSDFIYCSRGWYNTKTNTAKLYSGPVIHSENRILKSDSLYYNGIKKTAQEFVERINNLNK